MTFVSDPVIYQYFDQDMLERLFVRGIYSFQVSDAAAKAGIAESAAARGQAWMDLATLWAPYSDAAYRGFLSQGPLDLLLKVAELQMPLLIQREQQAHELELEQLRERASLAEIQIKTEGDISTTRIKNEGDLAVQTLRNQGALAEGAQRAQADLDSLAKRHDFEMIEIDARRDAEIAIVKARGQEDMDLLDHRIGKFDVVWAEYKKLVDDLSNKTMQMFETVASIQPEEIPVLGEGSDFNPYESASSLRGATAQAVRAIPLPPFPNF